MLEYVGRYDQKDDLYILFVSLDIIFLSKFIEVLINISRVILFFFFYCILVWITTLQPMQMEKFDVV